VAWKIKKLDIKHNGYAKISAAGERRMHGSIYQIAGTIYLIADTDTGRGY
jgi:hypothetical protein